MLLAVGADDDPSVLERAVARAREAGDEVTVAVYDEDGDPEGVERRVRDRLGKLGFEADVRPVHGSPGASVVELLGEGYDRIVMSGGERSPMGKVRLGSVAEYVLLNAPVTVTLVR